MTDQREKPKTWNMILNGFGILKYGPCNDNENHDHCRKIQVQEVNPALDLAYAECDKALECIAENSGLSDQTELASSRQIAHNALTALRKARE